MFWSASGGPSLRMPSFRPACTQVADCFQVRTETHATRRNHQHTCTDNLEVVFAGEEDMDLRVATMIAGAQHAQRMYKYILHLMHNTAHAVVQNFNALYHLPITFPQEIRIEEIRCNRKCKLGHLRHNVNARVRRLGKAPELGGTHRSYT